MSRSLGRSRWILAVVAMFVVGACSSAASPGASTGASTAASPAAGASSAANPSPVTGASCAASATVVKFWTSHTPPDSDVLTKIVNNFNTANADICVKMTIVKGSETDIAKLLTAIRGGVAPDVYMADRFTVPQRAAEGALDDITAEAGNLKDQHLPFAWNETQYKGKTYALPFDTDARALWYNKDLITAAGEDPAQLDISKGAPTIDTVVKIADKISKKDASATTPSWAGSRADPEPAVSPEPSIRAGITRGALITAASSLTSLRAR